MATAIVAMEEADLNRAAVCDIDYLNHRRSSDLGLRPGMQMSLRDLFIGMLTVSGNDAATELATEVSGSGRGLCKGDEPAGGGARVAEHGLRELARARP